MDEGTIVWDGVSGREYTYSIYRIGTQFKAVPGNYIFARETSPRVFAPIYVGETSDLSERFDNHHKMPCIYRNGATHIHVHTSYGGAEARRAEEQDIRWKWNPPCNG
jgi:hypothetical protein